MKIYVFVGNVNSPHKVKSTIIDVDNSEIPERIHTVITEEVPILVSEEFNGDVVYGVRLLGTDLLPENGENDFTLITGFFEHEFKNLLGSIGLFGWEHAKRVYGSPYAELERYKEGL